MYYILEYTIMYSCISTLLLKIKLKYSDKKCIKFIRNMYELFIIMVLGSKI